MNTCCCGPHIGLGKTLYETACFMCQSKSDCIQIFMGSPTQYNIRKFDIKDLNKTGDLLREKRKRLYVHAPYIINLASDNPELTEKGKPALQAILHTQALVDNDRTGTILHIGAKGKLENVIDHINSLNISSPLYLENCAEPSKFGKNMDELRKLKEGIDSHRVGFCLDTCHCHSSCLCDMTKSESIMKMFDDLDCKRTLVHLNDSKTEFGSGKDRHSVVGFGTIWDYHKPETFESLISLRNYCKENDISVVLETPSESIETYELNIFQR